MITTRCLELWLQVDYLTCPDSSTLAPAIIGSSSLCQWSTTATFTAIIFLCVYRCFCCLLPPLLRPNDFCLLHTPENSSTLLLHPLLLFATCQILLLARHIKTKKKENTGDLYFCTDIHDDHPYFKNYLHYFDLQYLYFWIFNIFISFVQKY